MYIKKKNIGFNAIDCNIRDAIILDLIDHPHFMHLSNYELDNRYVTMEMEKMDGDLNNIELSACQKISVLWQVIFILQVLEKSGIVHGDLFPDNLLYKIYENEINLTYPIHGEQLTLSTNILVKISDYETVKFANDTSSNLNILHSFGVKKINPDEFIKLHRNLFQKVEGMVPIPNKIEICENDIINHKIYSEYQKLSQLNNKYTKFLNWLNDNGCDTQSINLVYTHRDDLDIVSACDHSELTPLISIPNKLLITSDNINDTLSDKEKVIINLAGEFSKENSFYKPFLDTFILPENLPIFDETGDWGILSSYFFQLSTKMIRDYTMTTKKLSTLYPEYSLKLIQKSYLIYIIYGDLKNNTVIPFFNLFKRRYRDCLKYDCETHTITNPDRILENQKLFLYTHYDPFIRLLITGEYEKVTEIPLKIVENCYNFYLNKDGMSAELFTHLYNLNKDMSNEDKLKCVKIYITDFINSYKKTYNRVYTNVCSDLGKKLLNIINDIDSIISNIKL
jgi:serine/threonine protein kinase